MATWDVFHSDRLEVERGLDSQAVRQALARGDLHDDDLVRPAGTNIPWTPLTDFPALLEPPAEDETQARVEVEAARPPHVEFDDDVPPVFPEDDEDEDEDNEDEDSENVSDSLLDAIGEAAQGAGLEPEPAAEFAMPDDLDDEPVELGADDLELDDDRSQVALPISGTAWDEDAEDEYDPQEEDEAAAEFTLARGSAETVEELDLAAMVDVAFQLVLFFLVTATTVLYKSLEVPRPNPDSPAAAAAAQGRSRSLDDLKNDYILVEIDPTGVMKVDREPVAAEFDNLIERLREAREKTGRKAMLLTADFATPHRNAVLAYDAANEIGLGIAIARPTGSAPPAPSPPPASKKPARG